MAVEVEIWTDINCPFCYLGKRRFEEALAAFPHREQVRVVHKSFELDPTLPKDLSAPVTPHIAEKYGISEAQAAANERGLGAQAEAMGLTYQTSGRDFGNSFDIHRLLHFALEQGKQEAMLDALYAANLAEEQALFGNAERLVRVAVNAGFDEVAVRAVLDDPNAYADAVRGDEADAARLGARGVPFFVLDGPDVGDLDAVLFHDAGAEVDQALGVAAGGGSFQGAVDEQGAEVGEICHGFTVSAFDAGRGVDRRILAATSSQITARAMTRPDR
ncbi:DsbA family oxidoreductase [Nocardia crassostreae]|uniref:DsbA family oxidoreductase n=1 Tax=Nocardia crassostreae TaxID=53428 RepID=UPI000A00F930|nr:DsbA family oxidoreductase [Nocardia crassostreae]